MFPGQGSQHVGMGHDFIETFEQSAQLFEQAQSILGYDIKSLCTGGPAEKLDTTEISQPAIFVTSVAILNAIKAAQVAEQLSDVTPVACAGLSLGEYTALYASGVMDFEQALKLVQIRGQSMQQASMLRKGSMVSILGLEEAKVQELCQTVLKEKPRETDGQAAVLNAVNFNCPGQIVVSGTIDACQRAEALAPEFGASRAIGLRVAGAFHTSLMNPAAEQLAQALRDTTFKDFSIPVVANVDAAYYDSTAQVPQKLLNQLTSPVRWQQSIEKLVHDGVERFVEIGPGRVLTGLVKKISRAMKKKVDIVTVNGL